MTIFNQICMPLSDKLPQSRLVPPDDLNVPEYIKSIIYDLKNHPKEHNVYG